MTTLQLAALIVAKIRFHPHLKEEAAAVVVLDVLRAHDSWFCRIGEDGRGISVDLPYAVPSQLDLFTAQKKR